MINVAIIEDEDLEHRTLRSMLQRNVERFHIVGEVKNGLEAPRLLDEEESDLILLDTKITGPRGLEIM